MLLRKAIQSLTPPSNEMMHLDALRIVASIAIVAHHSKEYFFDPSLKEAVYANTAGLAVFVDLFFVVSGFVIAHVYSQRMNSIGEYGTFIKKRIARLYPLHVITLASMMAVWVHG